MNVDGHARWDARRARAAERARGGLGADAARVPEDGASAGAPPRGGSARGKGAFQLATMAGNEGSLDSATVLGDFVARSSTAGDAAARARRRETARDVEPARASSRGDARDGVPAASPAMEVSSDAILARALTSSRFCRSHVCLRDFASRFAAASASSNAATRSVVATPAELPLAARALAIIRASFRSAVASLARRSAASTSASARILRARSSLAAALANPTSRFISALVNPPRRASTAPAITIAIVSYFSLSVASASRIPSRNVSDSTKRASSARVRVPSASAPVSSLTVASASRARWTFSSSLASRVAALARRATRRSDGATRRRAVSV